MKLSGEVEKSVDNTEEPTGSDHCEEEEDEDETEAHLKQRRTQPLKPTEPSVSEAHSHSDSSTEEQLRKQRDQTTVRRTTVGVRKDLKRVETGGQRRKGCGVSGVTSPDDETLLSGNTSAFMDLLHEVTQNHGRWTRERWRQAHVNKQRR